MVLIDKEKKAKLRWGRAAAIGCIPLITLLLTYYFRKGPQNNALYKGAAAVTIQQQNGRYFFSRRGEHFSVKGVAGYSYMKDLSAAGGNTVVCWDTAALESVLQQAELYNLAVVVGIDVPGVHNVDFYEDNQQITRWQQHYSRLVSRFSNHPALFAWCLGNELIFPNSPTYDPFYKAYNSLLQTIHQSDPNHPVFTTVINVNSKNIFNLQWRVPSLDFIGINSYNSLRTVQKDINGIRLYWKGPYIISEWAPQGGWESPTTSWKAPLEKNSTQKAAEYYRFYTQYMPLNDPRFMGSLAFFWGSRQEYTHTFYSIYNYDSIPTEIKEGLQDCWQGTTSQHSSPQIADIVTDNSLKSADDIIMVAGSNHTASVLATTGIQKDSLRYAWQIVKEDWSVWGKVWVNFKQPAAEPGLFKDSTQQHPQFAAPVKEGAYRIFVAVYNTHGYCATANTPFYVIE